MRRLRRTKSSGSNFCSSGNNCKEVEAKVAETIVTEAVEDNSLNTEEDSILNVEA